MKTFLVLASASIAIVASTRDAAAQSCAEDPASYDCAYGPDPDPNPPPPRTRSARPLPTAPTRRSPPPAAASSARR